MLEWLYRIIGGTRTTPSELRARLVKAGVMTDTPACATAKPWNDIAVQPAGTTAANIGPGDTLVVTCARPLALEQIETLKARLLADLPAGCKVAVLQRGLTVAAVAHAQHDGIKGPIPVIPMPSPGRTT